MGVEIKLEGKIFDILKMLQKMSVLELSQFDVRDYEFRRVALEAQVQFTTDLFRYTDPKTNIVVKTAIGKKWAIDALDFDYDASLFANCVYWLAMFPDKAPSSIKLISRNEYSFTFDEENEYRGDTMNSWVTTVSIYFGVGNKWRKFLDNTYFDKKYLPECITEFMNVVYTIGNFCPVPAGVNGARGMSQSHDYWDLALLCIYNYYMKNDCKYTLEWLLDNKKRGLEARIERCKTWLDGLDKSSGDWNHFVEQNFLQDFVNRKDDGSYSLPKELWKGHFSGKVLPGENEEFSEFFTNASARILARGVRIALAVKDQLTDLPEEKLEELARRMAGEEGK